MKAIKEKKGNPFYRWLRYQGKVFKKNWGLLLLCMPTLIGLLLFHYVPMPGLIMAFKRYTFKGGIFGSDWAGLSNFRYFFSSPAGGYIVRNTVGYFLLFNVAGTVTAIVGALLMYEINHKTSLKIYQTCIQFPRFMSWVVVGFISYAILSPSSGVLNRVLMSIGAEKIDVYTTRWIWPLIMVIVHVWVTFGRDVIMYYAKLMGIDSALYEAAAIDGANRLQQIWHISLPSVVPLVVVLELMNLGHIFNGSFDPFYIIPRDTYYLYPVTDNVATFIMRGLQSGDYGAASAMGFAQSFIGLAMVLIANGIVRKVSPENAMF